MFLSTEFIAIHMAGCGHMSALPADTDAARRNDHKYFWCSTCGRQNHYTGESDLEKQKKKTERAERQLKYREEERDRARAAAKSLDYRNRALKGHLTRKNKRAAAGTCPCCKRTFRQLARHMKNKHPKHGRTER